MRGPFAPIFYSQIQYNVGKNVNNGLNFAICEQGLKGGGVDRMSVKESSATLLQNYLAFSLAFLAKF